MIETKDHFNKRLNMLGRKHNAMTKGYVTKVTRDGLIVVQPKKGRSSRGGGAIKLVLLLALGFFGFKAFTLATVGPVTYNERLASLEAGTMPEQLGAKALAIDPISAAMADVIGPVLR